MDKTGIYRFINQPRSFIRYGVWSNRWWRDEFAIDLVKALYHSHSDTVSSVIRFDFHTEDGCIVLKIFLHVNTSYYFAIQKRFHSCMIILDSNGIELFLCQFHTLDDN